MVALEVDSAIDAVEKIPKEARRILDGLASEWSDVADSKAWEVVHLKGAMTNQVYQVNWPTMGKGGVSRKVLVRIYGEGVDVFFDREDEIRTFECMSRHGQGPRLLGRFPNGRVEEFINAREHYLLKPDKWYSWNHFHNEGAIMVELLVNFSQFLYQYSELVMLLLLFETLSAADLRDPEISALVASKLKEFHELDMPGPRNVFLWDRLRKWLKTSRNLCSAEDEKEFRLDSLEEEITTLERFFSGKDQRIGFCHNDLQYGNIMIDEDTRQDYEYASFNPIAYDLANHFCEMAADYHTETPHVLDFNKYPDYEERKRFVQTYLSSSGETPNLVEVDNLLELIEKYALASHLVWGLWGIISERVNDIDFNYMEYAKQRFQQYWLRKSAT
ncbi:putative choline kinase 2 [Cocos nucifera]|uniref:Putative choline kinase 2 n=1 Tax=Cocos nucifera TaxID=13894 RepID=A0A8K0MZG0_COCNU|nr:putative choline kinase 2 [Cocos nucifera]